MKNKYVKNFIFLTSFIFAFYFFSPSVSLASLLFDHSSPRPVDTEVSVLCTVGDTFSTYDETDTIVDSAVECDGDNFFTSPVPVVYTVLECAGGCTDALLSDALVDPSYISQSSYTFVSESDYVVSSIGSCPDVYSVCYYDWLLMNLIIIFMLSLLCLGFFINFFPSKKESSYDY